MRRTAITGLILALMTGCTTSSGADHASSHQSPSRQPVIVYAAVGASETVGAGAKDPIRDAWPQVFYRTALPLSSVFYDFGIPSATVAEALSNEEPQALAIKPTLVTVWLNVNDLVAGVSAQSYGAELDQLIHSLRQGGAARVLVANTPYLDRLPAYLGCRAGTPPPGVNCPPVIAAITPAELDAAVNDYNAAIAEVAQREGAVLVDIHAQGEVPDTHPDWVSSDGFHPSTAGYASIAAAFATALKQATTAGATIA